MRCFCAALGLGVLLALGASTARAEDAVCATVLDALTRLIKTPSHQISTMSGLMMGNTTKTTEVMDTGSARYIQMDGKWHRDPITAEQQLQAIEKKRKEFHAVCKKVRDEAIDGVAATVYSVHEEGTMLTTDSLIWIAQASALPVHQQMDIDHGGRGKSHMEVRVQYTGIQAPPGVD